MLADEIVRFVVGLNGGDNFFEQAFCFVGILVAFKWLCQT
jgi:hypothetical protein